MAMTQGTTAEINVTPLIDVLLVLLIIFMVLVPQLPHGLKALIPQPSRAESPAEPTSPVVVQVLAGPGGMNRYKINEESFPKAGIEPRLAEIFAARQDKTMFLKGDAELEYSSIAAVVDDAHRAGVQSIGIMTPR